jgi:hypothetical protein
LKRYRPSTRGRIHPYKKRSSNIRIVLEEKVAAPVKVIEAPVKKEKKSLIKKEENKEEAK